MKTSVNFQPLSGRVAKWFARGCLLLGCLCSQPVLALDPAKSFHDYVKDAWSIDQGLPQISVLAIAQDAEGFIWVGTQAGAARFDGNRFTTYNPDNTPELPGLYVNDLTLDSAGRLWVGTYKGLAVYEDRTFRHIPFRQMGSTNVSLDIRQVEETASGEIIVAAVEGLFRVSGDEMLPLASQLAGQHAYSLLAEGDDLLVGGLGRVTRIVDGRLRPLPLPEDEASAQVTRLVKAGGVLWAGTSHGLFSRENGEWQLFDGDGQLRHQPVGALFEDSDNNLWVGTHQGLARIRDGELAEFIAEGEQASHPNVRSAFEDHEGNLWLGSQWEGVARFWNGWTRRYSAPQGLHDPIVWSLTPASDGGLWVGTNRGLTYFDGERFRKVLDEDELPHPSAYTLLDAGERLWIGTRTGMAWYVDGAVVEPSLFDPLSTTQVSGIIEDREGTTWLAASNGLYRYREGELFHYGEEQGLLELRVRTLHETSAGRILVGTQAGLFEVVADRARRVGESRGLANDIDVTAITELDGGELVLGTLAEELYFFNGEEWTVLTTGSGLPTNSPFFVAEDARGQLWVAGIRGLYSVPVADLRKFAAGTQESVRGAMLLSERGDIRGSQKAYCCNGAGNAKGFIRDETLWLPTRDGVIEVDTREITRNEIPPNVVIERVRIGSEWQRWKGEDPLRLPPDSRDITVEFTTLSFQQPDSVQMRYRLRGYDDNWQALESTDHRSVSYTNLPPGNLVFEVMGSNNAGVWAEDIATLPIVISPWFYETTWFQVMAIATFLLLVYGGHRYQVRHLEAQRNTLEQAVRQRTEELRVANRGLQEMTFTDPLTGLKNRRYLQSQLPADIAFYDREVRKPGNEDLVIMFALVDIDHFKRINDVHGHHAGDLVLEQFSRLLHDLVRSGDYVVRWGGEEFLIVFRPMPQSMTTVVAERIRTAVERERYSIDEDNELEVTASIGFVEYPRFGSKGGVLRWEDMVELADSALYYVKSHGRNGWAVLRPTPTTDLREVVNQVRSGLQDLIHEGDISVTFGLRGKDGSSSTD